MLSLEEFLGELSVHLETLGFDHVDVYDFDNDTIEAMQAFTNYGQDMVYIREDDAWYYLSCMGLV